MSLMLFAWLLTASAIALSALLVVLRRSKGSRGEPLDLETCKARLEDIGARLKRGELNEAEADAARLALFSRPRSFGGGLGHRRRGSAETLLLAGAGCLLIAGIGAVASYVRGFPESTGGAGVSAGSDGAMLARLKDYAASNAADEPASMPAGKQLPDVETLIERLAARLETTPKDIEGWRTLGWSYFHTQRYQQAATAFAKAVELDPSSAELKLSYEEAKKASESGDVEPNSSSRTETAGTEQDRRSVGQTAASEAMPLRAHNAQIRSMVDGLADRLESSPRDVEGWTRLMRSRVVLGERDAADSAFRKALQIFKDDSAASGQIKAAAIELGLNAE